MDVHCIFEKFLYRDEKNGYSTFSVHTEDARIPTSEYGNIICVGVVQNIYPDMPLAIDAILETEHGARLNVQSYHELAESNGLIGLLSSNQFKGIGPKTAKKILETAGNDFYGFMRQNSAEEVLAAIAGMDESKACLKERIISFVCIRELLDHIKKYGGNATDAESIYRHYGSEALLKLKKDPYLMRNFGISYNVCESIAKNCGYEFFDPRRIRALIQESFRSNKACGNIFTTFHDLCETISRIERKAAMGYVTDPMYIAAHIIDNDAYRIVNEESNIHIYETSLYEMEVEAAQHTSRLLQTGKNYENNKIKIEEIEKEIGITFSSEQKNAFQLIKKGGVAILTGGPGCGKTTVEKGLIRYLRENNENITIALCAPTGNAAKRMRKATGENAQTVHKLLEVTPFGEDEFMSKDEYDQLAYDVIICDEVSMLDLKLYTLLIRAIKNGALLLLIGDEAQLQSIGPGSVLRDLINTDSIPSCRLTQVYRQASGSSIIENSVRIRAGETDLYMDENTTIYYASDEVKLKALGIETAKKYYDKNMPFGVKIYTPVKKRKYSVSVHEMNRELQAVFNSKDKEFVRYGDNVFTVGDPVVFTRNNYKENYLNGDEGIITKISDDHKELHIKVDDNTLLISGASLNDLQLAYALTTHKAQGSECETAIIIVPKNPGNMLQRSLIYVASTRARKRNIYIVEKDALEIAIKNKKSTDRKTTLKRRLETIVSGE